MQTKKRYVGFSYETVDQEEPIETGDVDIAGIVATLRDNGFDGWFVLEQDTILDGEPVGQGPLRDVLASVAYLQQVAGGVPA